MFRGNQGQQAAKNFRVFLFMKKKKNYNLFNQKGNGFIFVLYSVSLVPDNLFYKKMTDIIICILTYAKQSIIYVCVYVHMYILESCILFSI